MLKIFARTALIAIALAGGTAGLGATSAAADVVRFGITSGGEQPTRFAQRYDRNGSCSLRQALRKADRLGLNRARIAGENRRVVAVSGIKRGRPVLVRFANDRGCPVIGLR